MRHNIDEEFLSIDVGSSWIGIARGSGAARLAQPLKTVPAGELFAELAELIARHNTGGIVVGLPRNLNGDDTPQTDYVRKWAAAAKKKIDKPFYWQDEALTSQTANSHRLSAIDSTDEHAAAAALILQDFLDTPKENRVTC